MKLVETSIFAGDLQTQKAATSPALRQRIEYWYEKLGFPKELDAAFRKALDEIPISDGVCIETYDLQEKDGRRNLLSALAMCDRLATFYEEKGIPEQILLDSLSDIPRWTKEWSELEGGLCLRQMGWLQVTLSAELFKLGRLQFCVKKAPESIPDLNVKKDDPVVEIHIPRGGSLDPAACDASFAKAEAFFSTYFPEVDYHYYTCHSWLLDDTIDDLLGEGSNITAFRKRFTLLQREKSDDIFQYVIQWNIAREDVAAAPCTGSFQRRLQQAEATGRPFYVCYGYRPR